MCLSARWRRHLEREKVRQTHFPDEGGNAAAGVMKGGKHFHSGLHCQALNEGHKWQVPKVLCKAIFLTRCIEVEEHKTKTKKGKRENVTLPSSMAFFAVP